jgi:hypothetical protein
VGFLCICEQAQWQKEPTKTFNDLPKFSGSISAENSPGGKDQRETLAHI